MAASSGSIDVSGTVQPVCNMAYTSAAVALGTILIGADGKNTVQTKSDAIGTTGDTFCNTNSATMTVVVKPLVTSATAYAPFVNVIPYQVTMPNDVTRNSGTDPAGATSGAVPVGTFLQHIASTDVVKIDTQVATGPVLAGTYSGTIEITLAP
jgi:hypothetical protein